MTNYLRSLGNITFLEKMKIVILLVKLKKMGKKNMVFYISLMKLCIMGILSMGILTEKES